MENEKKRKHKGGGGSQHKKVKWLVENVWSVHVNDGKTYYYNHVR
jgi:hypothetical protein